MRLRRLDLTRYGKFTDYSVDFGPQETGAPDFHIIYGLNEAGKSTSLSAYLDLLFGIEERTRYGFLHQGKAMEVGGCLEFNGASHEFKRIKQRANSLLDGQNQPLSDAILGSPLAGLTRDAYRTMFSLDDETLEDGGNAILESKGDLGELLFSASAGLAGISASLEAAAAEADAIFRKRASSTRIATLKRQINELKTQRDAIDIQASAFAALLSALKEAEHAYDEAMREKGAVRARHDALARLLRAWPLSADYHRVAQALGNFSDLPQPPAHWRALLPELMTAETTLQTRLATLDEREQRLREDLDGFAPDAAILRLTEEIEHLPNAAGRFSTAEEDLPKRRAALVERDGQVALIVRTLGVQAKIDPQTLLVPAATIGLLRDLIAARSGVVVAQEAAEREHDNTQAALTQARESVENDAAAGGAALSDTTVALLQSSLMRLRQSDLSARLRLSEQALPQAQSRFDAAFAALSPWRGDAMALRALPHPDAHQLENWRALLNQIDKRRHDAKATIRDLTTRIAETSAALALVQQRAGGIGDTEANRALHT